MAIQHFATPAFASWAPRPEAEQQAERENYLKRQMMYAHARATKMAMDPATGMPDPVRYREILLASGVPMDLGQMAAPTSYMAETAKIAEAASQARESARGAGYQPIEFGGRGTPDTVVSTPVDNIQPATTTKTDDSWMADVDAAVAARKATGTEEGAAKSTGLLAANPEPQVDEGTHMDLGSETITATAPSVPTEKRTPYPVPEEQIPGQYEHRIVKGTPGSKDAFLQSINSWKNPYETGDGSQEAPDPLKGIDLSSFALGPKTSPAVLQQEANRLAQRGYNIGSNASLEEVNEVRKQDLQDMAKQLVTAQPVQPAYLRNPDERAKAMTQYRKDYQEWLLKKAQVQGALRKTMGEDQAKQFEQLVTRQSQEMSKIASDRESEKWSVERGAPVKRIAYLNEQFPGLHLDPGAVGNNPDQIDKLANRIGAYNAVMTATPDQVKTPLEGLMLGKNITVMDDIPPHEAILRSIQYFFTDDLANKFQLMLSESGGKLSPADATKWVVGQGAQYLLPQETISDRLRAVQEGSQSFPRLLSSLGADPEALKHRPRTVEGKAAGIAAPKAGVLPSTSSPSQPEPAKGEKQQEQKEPAPEEPQPPKTPEEKKKEETDRKYREEQKKQEERKKKLGTGKAKAGGGALANIARDASGAYMPKSKAEFDLIPAGSKLRMKNGKIVTK